MHLPPKLKFLLDRVLRKFFTIIPRCRHRSRFILVAMLIGAAVTCFSFHITSRHETHKANVESDESEFNKRLIICNSSALGLRPLTRFSFLYDQLCKDMSESLYYFDRPGRLIPLMRWVSDDERNRSQRVKAGREWLKSQSVVVAATVRDAMSGLPNSVLNLQRLRDMFNASWLVFVENESKDATRSFLYNLTLVDPAVTLLGCDTVNSPTPCRMDIHYSSGRQHIPGWHMKRSFSEEVERGLVMSALRNQYLNYIYDNLADKASLLLVIDPDVSWEDWDLDNIAQGLFYFKTKPGLQQLCAHTTYGANIYDPCTLMFLHNKHYGGDAQYSAVDYNKLRNAGPDIPPVKVESCFQAFAFYRLSHLASRRLRYTRSQGEWMCEHNTLSRQLQEVYIDMQMRLKLKASNIG